MAQVTESELDSIVASLNVDVDTVATGQKRRLATYREMKDFFAGEVQFWSQYNGPPFNNIRQHFGQIHSFVTSALGTDSGSARTHLGNAVNKLRQDPTLSVYSGTPAAQCIASIDHKNNPKRGQGAGAYVLNQVSLQENRDKEYFYGVLSAALYMNPDLLEQFLNVDRTVFNKLREQITEFRNTLESDNQRIIGDMESWKTTSDSEINGLLEGSKTRFNTSYEEWKGAVETFQGESKEKIKALEGLYQEKLRLDAPAKYWQDLRDSYKKAGGWWTFGSVLLSAAVVGGIGWLLYNPPPALQQKEVTPGTIKAAILIAVALSIAGYIINLFVRLATSSIHLSRDARERLQLTHMFLSLVKEQAVEPKDRDIVLAALFSRADTGLLKHDGTPAMASPLAQLLDALKSK